MSELKKSCQAERAAGRSHGAAIRALASRFGLDPNTVARQLRRAERESGN